MSAVLKRPLLALRPMEEKDLSEIMAIERESYAYPWTEGIYNDCLRVGYCCWILEIDGLMAGYGVMSVAANESHILNICIRREHQRRGLGRTFLRHFIDLAVQHHAQAAFLEVRPSNRAAVALYHSVGFVEVGSRRDYYPAAHGREDALIMALDLSWRRSDGG